jgi:hypothetical protein
MTPAEGFAWRVRVVDKRSKSFKKTWCRQCKFSLEIRWRAKYDTRNDGKPLDETTSSSRSICAFIGKVAKIHQAHVIEHSSETNSQLIIMT